VRLEEDLLLADLALEARLRRLRRRPEAELRVETLPYDPGVLETLRAERAAGRALWLCTRERGALAERVAAHLGLFEGVITPDRADSGSLIAPLRARFGVDGWDECRAAAPRRQNAPAALWRLMRPHQWAKNLLLGVPLLAAHRMADAAAVIAVLGAFVAFCLCASSVYVLNDLFDLDADRAHPRKCRRPLAAGTVSIRAATALIGVLLAVAVTLTLWLPPKFELTLGTYYALTLLYSLVLKGLVLVDALALAGLYTLRIIAGATAASVALSFWLLLFSIFLFLSLAFVKRYAELDALRRRFKLTADGRGYHVDDLPLLQTLGSSAGYLSVLVLALYINSPEIAALYHRPKFIWLLCVLMLYWVSRVWMVAHRGAMHDDPVVFALKDRTSLVIGVAMASSVVLAI
jgi:4-hydroxybenzoate polyprenyltransferase